MTRERALKDFRTLQRGIKLTDSTSFCWSLSKESGTMRVGTKDVRMIKHNS